MTVLVAGVSPRALYVLQCREWRCKCNSAVRVQLPDDTVVRRATEDDDDDDNNIVAAAAATRTRACGTDDDAYARVCEIDLRNNFVGPRGVRPLLDVVAHCHALRTLRLCGQQLDLQAIEALCEAVRRHTSLVLLDVSHNPLTIAAGALLLELARGNTRVQEIDMTHTPAEHSSIALALDAQLRLNRDINALDAIAAQRTRRSSDDDGRGGSGGDDAIRTTTTAATSSTLTVVTTMSAADEAAAAARQRRTRMAPFALPVPPRAVRHALQSCTHRVSPRLYDSNPLPQLLRCCVAAQAHYHDASFTPPPSSSSCDDEQEACCDDTHMAAAADTAAATAVADIHAPLQRVYKVARWRRACELFPHATLVPPSLPSTTTTTASQQPQQHLAHTRTHPGLSWLQACIAAAATLASSSTSSSAHAWLQQLVLAPDEACDEAVVRQVGVYAVRVYVDGAWRYVLVDDYLPVTRTGAVAFAQPVRDADGAQCYLWPCLVEKALAKLYGGYHVLDNNNNNNNDSSNSGDNNNNNNNSSSSDKTTPCVAERLCARVMTCLTAGHAFTRVLHDGRTDTTACWSTLTALLPPPPLPLLPLPTTTAQDGSAHDDAAVCTRPRAGVAVALTRPRARMQRGVALYGLRERHAYLVTAAAACNGSHLVQLHDGDDDDSDDEDSHGDEAAVVSATRTTSTWWHDTHATLASAAADDGDMAAATAARRTRVVTAAMMRHRVLHYADVLASFDMLCLCRTLALRYTRRVCGAWTAQTAGGRASCATWQHNPHYTLRLHERGAVCVQLSLPAVEFTARRVEAMALHIIEADTYPLLAEPQPRKRVDRKRDIHNSIRDDDEHQHHHHEDDDDDEDSHGFFFFSRYVTADAVLFEGVLDAGCTYWLVPSTHTPQCHSAFTLTVASAQSAFVLDDTPQPLSAHWQLHEVDAEVCDGYSQGVSGDVYAQLALHAPRNNNSSSSSSNGRRCCPCDALAMPALHIRATVAAYEGDDDDDDDNDDEAAPRLFLSCTRRHSNKDDDDNDDGRDARDAVVLARGTPRRLRSGLVDGDGSSCRPGGGAAAVHDTIIAAHIHVDAAANVDVDEKGSTHDTRHCDAVAGSYRVLCSVKHAQPPRQQRRQRQQQRREQRQQRRVRRLHFSVWSSRHGQHASNTSNSSSSDNNNNEVATAASALRVRVLPPWPVHRVHVTWPAPHGSGSYYDAAPHNPQVEIVCPSTTGTPQRFVVTLTLTRTTSASSSSLSTSPSLSFAVVNNRGRLGEGLLGVLPASSSSGSDSDDDDGGGGDVVGNGGGGGKAWARRGARSPTLLLRSPYVQATGCDDEDDDEAAAAQQPLRVRCTVTLTSRDATDSLLIVPCLQPTGTVGEADVTVASCDGDVVVRLVSAVQATRYTTVAPPAP